MKKILVTFDNKHYPASALQYAELLKKDSDLLVVGVFLHANSYIVIPELLPENALPVIIKDEAAENGVKQDIAAFQKMCEKEGWSFRIHDDEDFDYTDALIKETRFSDLLLVEGDAFFTVMDEDNQPSEELKNVMHKAECPLLIVPEIFQPVETNVIMYNGSASSVYAMRQFALLFPELRNNKTYIVSMLQGKEQEAAFTEQITEYAPRYFPNLVFENLHEDTHPDILQKWLATKINPVMVLGAYSRSRFSMFIKQSLADTFIASHDFPIFVTHK